ncbi:MAG: hypothetical protein KAS07_04815 [Candidatus Pacebacteria bacterium]|nr:hypothetical protein [Candidatus Paceibacterota bacterium]
MFRPNDSEIIENTRKRREWEKKHPNENWKTGLTPERIKELEDMGVAPE